MFGWIAWNCFASFRYVLFPEFRSTKVIIVIVVGELGSLMLGLSLLRSRCSNWLAPFWSAWLLLFTVPPGPELELPQAVAAATSATANAEPQTLLRIAAPLIVVARHAAMRPPWTVFPERA